MDGHLHQPDACTCSDCPPIMPCTVTAIFIVAGCTSWMGCAVGIISQKARWIRERVLDEGRKEKRVFLVQAALLARSQEWRLSSGARQNRTACTSPGRYHW